MSFIELHLLQNFAPSNLNRDETNTPKSTQFGGYRRARISSQCFKREIRLHPDFQESVKQANGDLALRTKRMVKEIVTQLQSEGKDEETAINVVTLLLNQVKLKTKKENKTEYLLYIGKEEIRRLTAIALEHWQVLADDSKSNKIPKEVGNDVKQAMGKKTYAADVALFGRMIANAVDMNVDAACQVAHAISTNEVKMEMDFFTAVDDLLGADEQGSDMMGGLYFNSSCYYRYAQINLDILQKNMLDDHDLLLATVKGFLAASINAIPTGKQNSMAAQNPVSYARICVRDQGAPWSLVNAFTQPVRVQQHGNSNLELDSALRLEEFLSQLKTMYGDAGFRFNQASSYLDLQSKEQVPVPQLINNAVQAVAEITGG